MALHGDGRYFRRHRYVGTLLTVLTIFRRSKDAVVCRQATISVGAPSATPLGPAEQCREVWLYSPVFNTCRACPVSAARIPWYLKGSIKEIILNAFMY